MFHLIPAPLHRRLLPLAHRLRHRWRRWRKTPIAGVTVIARDAADRVLLVRHSYAGGAWTLPGGGMHRGEDPAAAAAREIHEELGCAVTALTRVGTLEETISGSPHKAHVFAGRIDDTPRPDRREVVDARFYPMHSLPQPLSALAWARLELLRGSQ